MTKVANQAILRSAEQKYTDTAFNVPALTNAGQILQLSTISQGSQDTNRIGDELEWQRLELRINCGFESGIAIGTGIAAFRVVVFQWHPNNASVIPTTNSILSAVSGTTATTANYVNDYKGSNRSFSVLMDRTVQLNSNGVGVCIMNPVLRQSTRGIKKVRYVAGSSSVGYEQLYLLAITDQGTGGAPPVYNMGCRMYFIDT